MARSRLCLVQGLLAGALLGLLAACTPPAPPIQVGSNHWAGYEGLYYARALGHLDAGQVRLLEFSSTQEALRAFRNGALDAVAVTLDEALHLAEQEQQPRIVLVMDISNGGDVLMARDGIDRLADLKGRRIGLETTTLGAYMLARILAKAELNASDVKVVHVPVDRHLQAFQKGEVDAVVTFEPVRSQLLKAHARELFSSREIPGEIVDVLVVRQGLINHRKDALCHLLEGYFSALAALHQDPERAARTLAGPEDITPDELVAAWQLMLLPGRDEAAAMLQAGQQGLAPTLGKLKKVMTANNLLTGDIDEKALLAPELMAGCAK